MDVSAVTSGTGTPAPAVTEIPTQTAPAAPTQEHASAPVSHASAQQSAQESALAPAIAKLFGSSSNPQPVTLNVSYRILKGNLGEIVTVFTDPKTGREVAQFPPEILIGLAEFFDQPSGATLDKSA
jgi:uncharacterized FlaG/YvyC family protein